jgi:hypothetical protein
MKGLHRVVCLGNRLFFCFERVHGQHRSEDLVRPDLVVGLDVYKDSGLQEVALGQMLDTWQNSNRQSDGPTKTRGTE